jgi:hypothetical protein
VINFTGEDDKKQIISKLEKLSDKLKRRYLKPNFVNYYCNSKNRQKAFEHKLQETYIDKINEKFDIFYYLKWIRQFKNLKKFIFHGKNESTIFKLLANNTYDVTINDYDDDFFNRSKNNKDLIDQWIKDFDYTKQSHFSNYILNK